MGNPDVLPERRAVHSDLGTKAARSRLTRWALACGRHDPRPLGVRSRAHEPHHPAHRGQQVAPDAAPVDPNVVTGGAGDVPGRGDSKDLGVQVAVSNATTVETGATPTESPSAPIHPHGIPKTPISALLCDEPGPFLLVIMQGVVTIVARRSRPACVRAMRALVGSSHRAVMQQTPLRQTSQQRQRGGWRSLWVDLPLAGC